MELDDYTAEFAKYLELRTAVFQTGRNNAVVYQIDSLLSKLDTLIGRYSLTNDELNKIAISKTEFGSNRNELIAKSNELEEIRKAIKTTIEQLKLISDNALRESGIYSNTNNGTNCTFTNNSVNAFPECVPIAETNIPNNLYLIKDKELENYNVILTEFLDTARKLYAELEQNGCTRDYAMTISELSMIINSSEKVLGTIWDLIDKKNMYNESVESIRLDDPNYDEYESYPYVYDDAKQIVRDIYNTNLTKFNAISRKVRR